MNAVSRASREAPYILAAQADDARIVRAVGERSAGVAGRHHEGRRHPGQAQSERAGSAGELAAHDHEKGAAVGQPQKDIRVVIIEVVDRELTGERSIRPEDINPRGEPGGAHAHLDAVSCGCSEGVAVRNTRRQRAVVGRAIGQNQPEKPRDGFVAIHDQVDD